MSFLHRLDMPPGSVKNQQSAVDVTTAENRPAHPEAYISREIMGHSWKVAEGQIGSAPERADGTFGSTLARMENNDGRRPRDGRFHGFTLTTFKNGID